MPRKDPALRKSIDLNVQAWREGDTIILAGGPLDPIGISKQSSPLAWEKLDKVLRAQGK